MKMKHDKWESKKSKNVQDMEQFWINEQVVFLIYLEPKF